MRGEDVEPVELEPLDLHDERPPRQPLRVSRRGIAAIAVVALGWIVLALVTRGDGHSSGATAPTTTPFTFASLPETTAIGFTGSTLPANFVNGLRRIGGGRYAISTGNKLFVVDAQRSERVQLGPGELNIEAQSGNQILVRSDQSDAIVTTDPIAIHAIPRDRVVIPAVEAGHWWYVRDDNVLQRDGTGGMRFPPNLRILAAVRTGFLALDTAEHSYVIWNGKTSRSLIPENNAVLGTSPDAIAFARGCNARGCTLQIDDADGRTKLSRASGDVYRVATFSPSGDRVALISTFGTVSIVDATSNLMTFESPSIGPLAAGMPATWATTADTLLVVQHFGIAVAPAQFPTLSIDGIQQLVALP